MNLKINFLNPNFLLTGLNTINPALNFTLVSKVMKYWLFLKNMWNQNIHSSVGIHQIKIIILH